MKKLILAASIALLTATTACAPQQPRKAEKKFHVAKHKVYHFSDGRVGYRDDDTMIWYWLILNQNNAASTSVGSTPTIVGGWSKGPAPTEQEIAEAQTQDQGVVETEAGEPVDATEAAAVEAAEPGLADTAADQAAATGEMSATVEFGVAAEGQVGEAADAGGGDTGSSDTGGGYDGGSSDAGGGGGDGGGGGGE